MIDWRHWHNEPYLIGGLILIGWLYAVLAGPLRRQIAPAAPFPRAPAWKFYSSLIIFYLAVGSPLDQVGERFLLSAHMLQHQLLIYPAAILFLAGLPAWMVDPALARPALRGLLRFLTSPLVCGLVFTLAISLWHMPALYEWALQNKLVHVAEHVMFFGAALFYWWPLLSPSHAFPPVSYATQMIYLLAIIIGMTPLFAYLVFTDGVLYPTYEYAPRLFPDFSAADDQLLAGVAMKLVGVFVGMSALGWSFYRWSHASQQRAGQT
ncbi:MAG: cytochrome c oxidase assembly protein [Opitutaceae bacterium]|nr:cytochrome c oxidase assembly protein [Opitutaceae bacterium]